MATQNVVLTDHQAAFVERLIESGRYENAREVLPDGVRLIESRETEEKARLKALREAARVGVNDMETGRFCTFQSTTSLARHLRSIAERAITRHKSSK